MVCEYKMMSEKNISCKYYKKGEWKSWLKKVYFVWWFYLYF
jgi:hypothetical protein